PAWFSASRLCSGLEIISSFPRYKDSDRRRASPPPRPPLDLYFLLELLELRLHLLPEGLLRRLLALVDEDRYHPLRSLDIEDGTLGLATLAVGDSPVHHLGLDAVVDAEEVLAGHLAEWFLGTARLRDRERRTGQQGRRDDADNDTWQSHSDLLRCVGGASPSAHGPRERAQFHRLCVKRCARMRGRSQSGAVSALRPLPYSACGWWPWPARYR